MNAAISSSHDSKEPESCLERVFAAIDAANAEDPKRVEVEGEMHPGELIYGKRMSATLDRLHRDASDPLRIAARAQHVRRWIIPRSDYPMDKTGYLRWRADLKVRHAEIAGAIMAECGCPAEPTERVVFLMRKKGLKRDAEAQALEDVACLVFLEHYFADFASGRDDDKLISILQKTWRKMSDRGHDAALELDFAPRYADLVARALAEPA